MVGVMMLTSKGTAGIAGGAFIVLASTITAVGHVPLAALALIVGIDRLLNEGRVFINVLGNALGAIVIGKWENGFDADRAHQVLAGRSRSTSPTKITMTSPTRSLWISRRPTKSRARHTRQSARVVLIAGSGPPIGGQGRRPY